MHTRVPGCGVGGGFGSAWCSLGAVSVCCVCPLTSLSPWGEGAGEYWVYLEAPINPNDEGPIALWSAPKPEGAPPPLKQSS